MKLKLMIFVSALALILTGCSGNDEEKLSESLTEMTDVLPVEAAKSDVLTIDGSRFFITDSTEYFRSVLGDRAWISGPVDFGDAENDEYLVFCLDMDYCAYFSPNYGKEGLAEKFVMYNGLTGASGTEEIAAVLGSGCIRVSDEEGEHFLEVFINGSEIDYSGYDLTGTFDEVFERVFDDCYYNKMASVYDTMIIYCFNCSPEGKPDSLGGHIAEIYKGAPE